MNRVQQIPEEAYDGNVGGGLVPDAWRAREKEAGGGDSMAVYNTTSKEEVRVIARHAVMGNVIPTYQMMIDNVEIKNSSSRGFLSDVLSKFRSNPSLFTKPMLDSIVEVWRSSIEREGPASIDVDDMYTCCEVERENAKMEPEQEFPTLAKKILAATEPTNDLRGVRSKDVILSLVARVHAENLRQVLGNRRSSFTQESMAKVRGAINYWNMLDMQATKRENKILS